MSADRQLVDRVRLAVGEQLNKAVGEAEANGQGEITGQNRRMLAHKLIGDQLQAVDAHRINSGGQVLSEDHRDELAKSIVSELFELGRIQQYIDDQSNTDIVINGHDVVWLTKRNGAKVQGEPIADSDDHLIEIIQTAARRGRSEHRWDPASPTLDLQLPSGDRLNAIAWVSGRPSISIRRHDFDINRLKQLIDLGTITEPIFHLLKAMVLARFNVIVAGGTGAGKTTFMRCLLNEVPPDERLVTVEDSLELGLNKFGDHHPDLVDLEARRANVEGVGALGMDELAINALRMNPGRLIVGEVRGDEALTLLLACTQGNDGALCTLHADSSQGVFGRLQMYLAMTRERFEPQASNLMIAQGIDAIVHVAKLDTSHRVVTSIREVTGSDNDMVISNEIYTPDTTGRAAPRFTFSAPRLERLERAGFDRRWLSQHGDWEGT